MTTTMRPKATIAMTILICVSLTPGVHSQVKQTPAKVGDPAPEIGLEKLLQAQDRTVANLKALKGDIVVLEFWATWCGPCVTAIPHLNELIEKYEDKPVRFISITDEKEDIVTKFLKKRPIRGWVGLDTDRSLFKEYGVSGIPMTVLIDKRGRAVAVTYPTALTEKILDEMLAGNAPSLPILDMRQARQTADTVASDQSPPLFEISIRPSTRKGAGMTFYPGRLRIDGYSIRHAGHLSPFTLLHWLRPEAPLWISSSEG